ncbi:MAG TPA: ABC transporter permease, partial [Sphingobacteriaceae bacterium]
MNNRLLLRIAFSLLKARLGQTIVAGIGVMFGIGMFIALVSFMTGLNQMLDNLTITRTPHIRLYKEIRPSREQPVELSPRFRDHTNFVRSIKPKDDGRDIRNSQSILHALAKDPRVYDVAPKVLTPVFFNIGGIETSAVINGIDPVTEEKLFPVGDYLLSGSMNDLATIHNSIIIGHGIAAKMLIRPGDRIRVTTAQGDQALLKVVGIIQFGLAEIDDVQSYTSIQTCRNLLGKPTTYVTDLEVKLHDLSLAPAMARQYSRLFDVEAMDIQTANAQFETGSNVRSIISYAVGVTLLVVAGFGIY